MATLANLNVIIGADTKGLTGGLRSARKQAGSFSQRSAKAMRGFRSSANNAVSSVVNFRSAIGVLAGSAGVGLLVAKELEAIDSTAKFADMIGEGTKEIVGLQHAAEMTAGVTGNQFNQALQRMTRRVAEAAKGTGEAKDAIKQLGLDASALNQMGPAAAFQQISGAMQDIDSQGERVRLAFKLFDSEGAKLVNTLSAGPEEIRKLVDEADRLGLSFSRIDAAKIEAANDAITRAQGAFSGVARTLTIELAPYIEAVANEFAGAAVEANGFKGIVINVVEGTVKSVAFMADAFRSLKVVWKGIEIAFASVAVAIWETIDMLVGNVYRILSRLPGDVGDQYEELAHRIGSATDTAYGNVSSLAGEIKELTTKPLASTSVENFFDTVKAKAQESAEAVAESKRSMAGTVAGGETGDGLDDEQAQKRIENIRASLASEKQLLQQGYEQKREFLTSANESLFEDEKERNRLLESLEASHQDRMRSLNQKGLSDIEKLKQTSWSNQTKTVLGNIADMTAGVAQGNRSMFEINKAAALAEAALSLKSTVVDAYRWGNAVGGPAVGATYAAIAGAAQVANMAKIANTSFGGSAAPSVGGTAATPVTGVSGTEPGQSEQQTEPAQRIYVELTGNQESQMSAREWREFMRNLQDEAGDAQLVF